VDAALPPTSSFPSGHTGAAICLFGGIAVIVVCTVRAWWRWLVVATAAVLVIAVALARMYRGAHYLTDALGAVVLAVPWLLVTLWAVHLAAPPGGRRPSPAGHGQGATPPPLTTR
jgi:undecaprenyl-diphosphatase